MTNRKVQTKTFSYALFTRKIPFISECMTPRVDIRLPPTRHLEDETEPDIEVLPEEPPAAKPPAKVKRTKFNKEVQAVYLLPADLPEALVLNLDINFEGVYHQHCKSVSIQTIATRPPVLPPAEEYGEEDQVPEPEPPETAPVPGPQAPVPVSSPAPHPPSSGTRPKVRHQCMFAGCTKSFSQRGDLVRHEGSHEGTVFKCDKCPSTFTLKKTLLDILMLTLMGSCAVYVARKCLASKHLQHT